ncbi:MAG: hypothetical protein HY423_02060 [Candidatus Lambdaproteobacteria bacterium]|nr:hypothetical protein [Candidatus Lambdaproteobacteria bacterium]
MELFSVWIGDEPLWKVFWYYGALTGFLIVFLYGVVVGELVPRAGGWGWLIELTAVSIAIVAITYISVAIWRSAWNTRWRIFGHLARWAVVAAVWSVIVQYFVVSSSPQ